MNFSNDFKSIEDDDKMALVQTTLKILGRVREESTMVALLSLTTTNQIRSHYANESETDSETSISNLT